MNRTLAACIKQAADSNARNLLVTSPVALTNASDSEKVRLETPCFLVYTRLGLVPYVTSDLVEKHLNVDLPAAVAVPISSVIEHMSSLESSHRGLHEFAPLRLSGKRPVLYLTAHECLPKCDTHEKIGLGDEKLADDASKTEKESKTKNFQATKLTKLSFWTRHGRANANASFMNRLVKLVQPSMFQAGIKMQLDDPVFFFSDVSKREDSKPIVVTEETVDHGVVFDTVVQSDPFSVRAKIEAETATEFARISESDLRVSHSIWHPVDILDAVAHGVDLFVATLPYIAASHDHALTFPYTSVQSKSETKQSENADVGEVQLSIDLASNKHANAHVPFVDGCKCFACARYTRAYVHHLVVANELLARTAIMIHNLAHFYSFANCVREAVRNDSLAQYSQFVRQQLANDNGDLDAALRRSRSRRPTVTRETNETSSSETAKRLRTEKTEVSETVASSANVA